MSILLPEHVDQAVANTLENTAKPLSTNVGNTLGDLWFLVFGGISNKAEQRRIRYAVELDKFKEELEQKCNNIPEEDLKEPDTQIAGQALEKSKYCVEQEKLRSMFSSLIASSMMKSKEGIIHPSYAEILIQMSSDDANALLELNEAAYYPTQNYIVYLNNSKEYHPLFNDVWRICVTLDDIAKCRMLTTSLKRLGLIEMSYSEHIIDNSKYDSLNNKYIIDALRQYVLQLEGELSPKEVKIDSQKGVIRLTEFGRNFLRCVL